LIDRKVNITFTNSDVNLYSLKLREKIGLKNIQFHGGSAKLLKKSYPTLKKLVQFLKDKPNIEIEISGHICCYSYDLKPFNKPVRKAKEKELSTQRAKFVHHYLIVKGINKNRLSYAGYGFQLPLVYPENSDEDRSQNRRVEVIITKI